MKTTKEDKETTKYTYLMTDGRLFKIGQSSDPEGRLKSLKTGNLSIELVTYGKGVTEKYLHEYFFRDRQELEWFDLTDEKVAKVKRLIENGESGREKGCIPVRTIRIQGGQLHVKNYGKRYSLADAEKKKIADGVRKSDQLSSNYKIDFGKHYGKKMKNVVLEDYQYCVWYYDILKSNTSKSERKKSRKYKAFAWAVNKNKPEDLSIGVLHEAQADIAAHVQELLKNSSTIEN